MRLLLDTSVLIQWHAGTLRTPAIKAVERAETVAVSAVSAWEIAIKQTLSKLKFPDPVEEVVAENGFLALPATLRHGDRMRQLPAHHSDPFDRLLLAQALEDGFTILTSDRVFELYRVPIVLA